jgi:hypothetical protein
MRYFESEGALFRGEQFPAEVFRSGGFAPYKGDAAKVYMFGNEISEDEAKAMMEGGNGGEANDSVPEGQ